MSNDQLAILNGKHKEKLSFSGCDEWMKIEGSQSSGGGGPVFFHC